MKLLFDWVLLIRSASEPLAHGLKKTVWWRRAASKKCGDQTKEESMRDVCRNCGCQESEARADARTLGLQQELQRGTYTCCQIVAWADEQWLAWMEAAEQDGQPVEDVTKPLEAGEAEAALVPVRRPDRHEPPLANSPISGPSGGDRAG
jgi:hypothetical protein